MEQRINMLTLSMNDLKKSKKGFAGNITTTHCETRFSKHHQSITTLH